MRPPIRTTESGGDLSEFLHKYKFQPKLTRKLDDLENLNLTPELLNEIVLWKVNRYVSLDWDQLRCIDALRKLKPGEHEKLEANPLRIAETTEIVKVGENAWRSMIWNTDGFRNRRNVDATEPFCALVVARDACGSIWRCGLD